MSTQPTASEKFNSAIQEMVAEKTLSLEALTRVNQLKDLVSQQERDLEIRASRISSLQAELRQEQVSRHAAEVERDALKARETSVTNREAKLHEATQREAVAVATSAAYRDAMSIVFAPNAVRERVVAMAGRSLPNGGYSNENEDKSVSRTEGYDVAGTPGNKTTDQYGARTSL